MKRLATSTLQLRYPNNPPGHLISRLGYNHTMLDSLENTELVWVNQPQKLRDIADSLARQDILAIDTESNSLYAYQEQVCLIQISIPQQDILIDALALPDLSPLRPIFNAKDQLKVFHAAEYDLICLYRDYGFRFQHLFDTMIAARTLGIAKVSLGRLLEQFFDLHLEKKYQRANWGRRPLKQEMINYARLDSHYLIPLQAQLRRTLEGSGRWELALEDFRRLPQNIEDTTESAETDFWKLNGARDLAPKQAAVLKSLYQFREATAKAQNRPTFKVISHQALVAVAQASPTRQEDLSKIAPLSGRLAKRYGRGLIAAVRKGQQAAPEYPPRHQRPENAVLARIDALRNWRKGNGHHLGVPSDVVLPRDVLNRIAWQDPQSIQELGKLMQDVPYRFKRFGTQIMLAIEKGDIRP